MRAATTSIQAYHSLVTSGSLQPREQQVMAAFGPMTKLTLQQISEAIGMPINAVCGRVRALLDKGVLEVVGESVDPTTNKAQQVLALAKRQTEIF